MTARGFTVLEEHWTNRAENGCSPIAVSDGFDQKIYAIVPAPEKSVLFSFEVAEERPRGDVGLFGDIRDGNAVESLFSVEAQGRLDQSLARLLFLPRSEAHFSLAHHSSVALAAILHWCKYAGVQQYESNWRHSRSWR